MKRVWFCALAILLGSCGSSEKKGSLEARADAKPDVLSIVIADEPASLDPHKTTLMVENTLLMYLMQGLVDMTPEGQIAPGAASSWEVSADGLLWRFTLRPDLRWSDGVAITAEDFVYSFRRALAPETAAPAADGLYDIKNAQQIQSGELPTDELGVIAETTLTLNIELERPNPYLLNILVSAIGSPVPRHVLEVHGDAWVRPVNWVGNGKYVLQERIPSDRVVLSSIYPDETDFDVVRFLPITSAKVAYNRYRAGEVHAIPELPRDIDLSQHVDDLRDWEFSAIRMVSFNHAKAPFSDVRIRKALSLVVDQAFIAQTIAKPPEIAAFGFVPIFVDPETPSFPKYSEESAKMARSLLADAGYSAENPLTISLRHSTSAPKAIPVALMGAWQKIGVQVTLQGKETAIHYNEISAGDFDVALTGRVAPARSEEFIDEFTLEHTDINLSRYSNPRVKELWEELKAEPEVVLRESISREIQKILIADVVAIPLFFSRGQGLVRPEIQGWEDNYYNIHPLEHLSWK